MRCGHLAPQGQRLRDGQRSRRPRNDRYANPKCLKRVSRGRARIHGIADGLIAERVPGVRPTNHLPLGKAHRALLFLTGTSPPLSCPRPTGPPEGLGVTYCERVGPVGQRMSLPNWRSRMSINLAERPALDIVDVERDRHPTRRVSSRF